MDSSNDRYDRNTRFFGKEGQNRLAAAHVVVVGIGGLGTHVVQHLALLGVGYLTLIDAEELDGTNFNRYVGVRHDDPVPGTPNVSLAARLVKDINPDIQVTPIADSLMSRDAFNAVITSDYVFGCLDTEGARLILAELSAAYLKPYFDLGTDIILGDPLTYGGRICVAWDGNGCLFCYDEIDVAEAQRELATPQVTRDRQDIYGVSREALGQVGPSVVSINGVVAAVGVTEFMLVVTGIRNYPRRLLRYRAHMGGMNIESGDPAPDCYYCSGIRGKHDAADVQRYIEQGASR